MAMERKKPKEPLDGLGADSLIMQFIEQLCPEKDSRYRSSVINIGF
jgi:hypothetical protein